MIIRIPAVPEYETDVMKMKPQFRADVESLMINITNLLNRKMQLDEDNEFECYWEKYYNLDTGYKFEISSATKSFKVDIVVDGTRSSKNGPSINNEYVKSCTLKTIGIEIKKQLYAMLSKGAIK